MKLKNLLASLSVLTAVGAALALWQPESAFALNGPTVTIPSQSATYSASFTVTPATTSNKDFLTITGSATQVVRVQEISCLAVGSTANTNPVLGVVRSTADTGGTAAAQTAVPADSSDAAATAVVDTYASGAPTSGTAVGNYTQSQVVVSTTAPVGFDWKFNAVTATKPIILRGVAQQFALNTTWGATTSLSCTVTWTEGSF